MKQFHPLFIKKAITMATYTWQATITMSEIFKHIATRTYCWIISILLLFESYK